MKLRKSAEPFPLVSVPRAGVADRRCVPGLKERGRRARKTRPGGGGAPAQGGTHSATGENQ